MNEHEVKPGLKAWITSATFASVRQVEILGFRNELYLRAQVLLKDGDYERLERVFSDIYHTKIEALEACDAAIVKRSHYRRRIIDKHLEIQGKDDALLMKIRDQRIKCEKQ